MRPWLTRNVRLLSGVSLAQDAASELLYPIMPIVLTSILGAPPVIVGAIEGVSEGVSALVKYFAGRISDRVGRKGSVVVGYGLAAAGKLVIAASTTWAGILVGRVTDRIGKGMRGAPRDALLVHGADRQHFGKIFGVHRAADNFGAAIGPALGLLILAITHNNLRTALWIAIIPATLSALLTLGIQNDRAERQHMESRKAPSHTELPPRVRMLAALLGVIALVNFPDALLLLHLAQVGYSASAILLIYMLFNFGMALIAFPAGMLADRLPKSRVYAVGLLCFAAGYLGLGLAPKGPLLIVSFFVYGGFVGVTDGVGKAWISALTPDAQRGHAQGLLQGLTGGAVLIAGIWAGLAWDVNRGLGYAPLVISGVTTCIAAVVLFIMGRHLDA